MQTKKREERTKISPDNKIFDADDCKRGRLLIDLGAIERNVKALAGISTPGKSMLAVVKADAYGHGACEVASALKDLDCLHGFGVATPEEAFSLRASGIDSPILVLGYSFPYACQRLIDEGIAVTCFSPDCVETLEKCAARRGKKALVHLKVDTGMSRIGVRPNDEGFLLTSMIAASPHLDFAGIYTHFSQADEAGSETTLEQFERFVRFVSRIESELDIKIPLKHSENSAAMLAALDLPQSVARPGIAIYGVDPAPGLAEKAKITLTPALSLASHIVMLKECDTGTPISYGATFITKRKTKVATVPIGYGDGYPRALSNCGEVLVRGKRAPIIGRVCMDFLMVDVTDIEDAACFDEVVLIGKMGEEEITVESLCSDSGAFAYEVLCGLGAGRLPRLYKA